MLQAHMLLQHRYRIVRLLKQGGMGDVYEAIDQRLNSQVAIKCLTIPKPDLLRAFQREAILLSNLQHPALPHVSDSFNEQHRHFLVMNFIPGDDLEEMLQNRGMPFAVDDVLRWTDQLLDVLNYLHSHTPPILHRDIKPQNLKITAHGQLMLLDFGLAKGSVGLQAMTSQHSVFGFTQAYAPLEQIQGAGTNEQSDLYALGATLYHLVTNRPPPDALTRAAAHIQGQPDPLTPAHVVNRAVPLSFSTLLMSLLALDYKKRPATAATVRNSLSTSYTSRLSRLRSTIRGRTRRVLLLTNRMALKMRASPHFHGVPLPVSSAGQPTLHGNMPARVRHVPSSRRSWPVFKKVRGPQWYWWIGIVGILLAGAGLGAVRPWIRDGSTSLPAQPLSETIVAQPPSTTIPVQPTPGSVIDPTNAREIQRLRTLNHRSEVSAEAWRPDGTLLATASYDKSVRLWHADGTLFKELQGHTDMVFSVAWSPDGSLLASASRDTKVRLWHADGTLFKELSGHTDYVLSVAWSPDGALLASASHDGTIRLWRTDGALFKELQGHTDYVNSISWSPDGSFLASASADNTIRLWNTNGTLLKTLTGHTWLVWQVAWSPDSAMLASASGDGTVRLWRTDGTLLKELTGHTDMVIAIAWSPDARTLASASSNNVIRLWTVDGILLKELQKPAPTEPYTPGITSLDWNPEGTILAAALSNNTVQLWSSEGGLIQELTGHTNSVEQVQWSPNGTLLASTSRDTTVRLWGVK